MRAARSEALKARAQPTLRPCPGRAGPTARPVSRTQPRPSGHGGRTEQAQPQRALAREQPWAGSGSGQAIPSAAAELRPIPSRNEPEPPPLPRAGQAGGPQGQRLAGAADPGGGSGARRGGCEAGRPPSAEQPGYGGADRPSRFGHGLPAGTARLAQVRSGHTRLAGFPLNPTDFTQVDRPTPISSDRPPTRLTLRRTPSPPSTPVSRSNGQAGRHAAGEARPGRTQAGGKRAAGRATGPTGPRPGRSEPSPSTHTPLSGFRGSSRASRRPRLPSGSAVGASPGCCGRGS